MKYILALIFALSVTPCCFADEPTETYTYEKVDDTHVKVTTTRVMTEIIDVAFINRQIDNMEKQKLEQAADLDESIARNQNIIDEAEKVGCNTDVIAQEI